MAATHSDGVISNTKREESARGTSAPALLQSRSEGGTHMADVSSLIKQLKAERDRVAKQLSGMDAALRAFAGVYGGSNGSVRSARQARRGSQLLREHVGQRLGERLSL